MSKRNKRRKKNTPRSGSPQEQASRHRQKKEKSREWSKRRQPRKIHPVFIVVAGIIVLVLLAIAIRSAPPDYVQCVGPEQGEQQHFHFNLFIQIGDATQGNTQFLRIDNNMGVRPTVCAWPVHVHEEPRGSYYTLMHVESPYTAAEHRYTLGDLFDSWGSWLGTPIAFNSGRVSYYQSANIEVRIAESSGGEGIDADPWGIPHVRNYDFENMVLPNEKYVMIWVHDPYITLESSY